MENRKSKVSEARVKATEGLKMVLALLFILAQVAPTRPEAGE